MKIRIIILCFCIMLVSKVCLALETTPICNLGSERLYENFINECVSIGVNKNEFSVLMLKRGDRDDRYSFYFPKSNLSLRNHITFIINSAGYVTLILIDGSNVTKESTDANLGTIILMLKAIGLTEMEVEHAIKHFQKSTFTPAGGNGNLYFSDKYTSAFDRTITIIVHEMPDTHIETFISAE